MSKCSRDELWAPRQAHPSSPLREEKEKAIELKVSGSPCVQCHEMTGSPSTQRQPAWRT